MRSGPRSAHLVAALALAAHLAGGIAALLLLPHGFAPTDIHLWSNTVIPAVASLAAAATLVRFFFLRGAAPAVSVLIAAAAGGWASAVVVGIGLFPSSMTSSRYGIPAAVALALLVLARWASDRTAPSILALSIGGGLGTVEVLAQRAPLPSTRPLGGTLSSVRGEPSNEEAAMGQIVFACGKNKLRLSPVLTFQSRSPDRTWTLLSPDAPGAHRRLSHYVKTSTGFRAAYIDDGESTLVAVREKKGRSLDIDAMSKLETPVYSHINSWTTIHVPFDATISFGPTGQTRFPIEPADYPTGRPVQLAYLGADLTLHVVRARDAEKGPFTELAKGPLKRDESLSIELRPNDAMDTDKGCRLVFEDWTSQLSTEPSPTAGWGLPQNSIQFFSRDGESLVLLTLAETGPGRGFDSVGHAAGTYRNRLRVERIR